MVRGASWEGHAGDGLGRVHGDVQEVLQRSEGAHAGVIWSGRVHGGSWGCMRGALQIRKSAGGQWRSGDTNSVRMPYQLGGMHRVRERCHMNQLGHL